MSIILFVKLAANVEYLRRHGIWKTSAQNRCYWKQMYKITYKCPPMVVPAQTTATMLLMMNITTSCPNIAKPHIVQSFIFCSKVHFQDTNVLSIVFQIFSQCYLHLKRLDKHFYSWEILLLMYLHRGLFLYELKHIHHY